MLEAELKVFCSSSSLCKLVSNRYMYLVRYMLCVRQDNQGCLSLGVQFCKGNPSGLFGCHHNHFNKLWKSPKCNLSKKKNKTYYKGEHCFFNTLSMSSVFWQHRLQVKTSSPLLWVSITYMNWSSVISFIIQVTRCSLQILTSKLLCQDILIYL